MSAELNIEHLRKVFATGVAAVDDVSFRIERGEIVVLLGPSGCGKTTTLRCVAGLEHPTSGIISIGGNVVSAPERGCCCRRGCAISAWCSSPMPCGRT